MDASQREAQREERRRKILERGASRLNKITSTYSAGIPPEAPTLPVSRPAPLDTTPSTDSLIENGFAHDIPDKDHSDKASFQKDAFPHHERDKDLPEELTRFVSHDLPENELLDLPASSTESLVIQETDSLGWFHSILFTLIALVSLSYWLYQVGEIDGKAQDPLGWAKQVCHNMVWMAEKPLGSRMTPIKLILGSNTMVHATHLACLGCLFFTGNGITHDSMV